MTMTTTMMTTIKMKETRSMLIMIVTMKMKKVKKIERRGKPMIGRGSDRRVRDRDRR